MKAVILMLGDEESLSKMLPLGDENLKIIVTAKQNSNIILNSLKLKNHQTSVFMKF